MYLHKDSMVLLLLRIVLTLNVTCKSDVGKIRNEILESIPRFCPSSSICGNNNTNTYGTHSCCTDCSCSDDCSVQGNCCFYTNDSSRSPRYASCFYLRSKKPDTAILSALLTYNMVDTCPNKSRDDVDNCGNTRVSLWGSMLPVYSRSRKTIYKNKICASCHDVEDGVAWKSTMVCDTFSREKQFSFKVIDHLSSFNTGQIPDHCYVVFAPPLAVTTAELKTHECFITEPPKCSSGDFDVPSWSPMSRDEIILACENSNFWSPYLINSVYRNVFCFWCSGKSRSEYVSMDARCKRFLDGSKQFTETSFIAVLDMEELKGLLDQPKPDVPLACEIAEPDNCSAVHCPVGQIYNRRIQCYFPVTFWKSEAYDITLKLIPRTRVSVSKLQLDVNNTRFAINDYFKAALPKPWKLVKLFYQLDTGIYRSNATIKWFIAQYEYRRPIYNATLFFKYLDIAIRRPWSWDSDNIQIRMQSKFFEYNTPKNVNRDGKPPWSTYLIDLDLELSEVPHERGYIGLVFRNFSPFAPSVVINKLYFCKLIELNDEEFTLYSKNTVLHHHKYDKYFFENEFFRVASIDGRTNARVCIYDLPYKRQTNSSVRQLSTIYIILPSLFNLISTW